MEGVLGLQADGPFHSEGPDLSQNSPVGRRCDAMVDLCTNFAAWNGEAPTVQTLKGLSAFGVAACRGSDTSSDVLP
jgi:hypothetical protein